MKSQCIQEQEHTVLLRHFADKHRFESSQRPTTDLDDLTFFKSFSGGSHIPIFQPLADSSDQCPVHYRGLQPKLHDIQYPLGKVDGPIAVIDVEPRKNVSGEQWLHDYLFLTTSPCAPLE